MLCIPVLTHFFRARLFLENGTTFPFLLLTIIRGAFQTENRVFFLLFVFGQKLEKGEVEKGGKKEGKKGEKGNIYSPVQYYDL